MEMILLIQQMNPSHRGKFIGTIGILTKYKPVQFTAELKYLQHRLLLDLSDYPIKDYNQRVFVYGKLFVYKIKDKLLFKLKVYHIERTTISNFTVETIGSYT